MTAEMGSIAVVKAYSKIGSIDIRVGIALKEGIRPLSSSALFSKALSSIYSGGVCK